MPSLGQEPKDIFLTIYDLNEKEFNDLELYMKENGIPFIISLYNHVFYKENEVKAYLKEKKLKL